MNKPLPQRYPLVSSYPLFMHRRSLEYKGFANNSPNGSLFEMVPKYLYKPVEILHRIGFLATHRNIITGLFLHWSRSVVPQRCP